ncbi:MAG: glycosyltransferase family 2 protein [Bacteroidales bacterium]|nr:glycosyltransferase family 2 protein [Bacteroidales bacterium]
MPEISLVVITFNEENNIESCILSAKDIVDDIVVVDSFSTDNTEEICKKHDVRFIKHKFEGHIEQKNWAISQAKYPHILSLDADEALSPELKNSIYSVKNNWNAEGYYFKRLTNYCGQWIKHCGWYPDKKLRLWDSRKGKWEGINPHDKFELQKGCNKVFLKGDLLHYSFNSINQHVDTSNKFSEIKAKIAFNNGEKPNLFNNFFSPIIKFIRDYFFRLGFLDGFYGFVICVINANSTFLKYSKLRQYYRDKKKNAKN